ncbi:MAG: ChaN family lipoprotein [Lutibacter sp.]
MKKFNIFFLLFVFYGMVYSQTNRAYQLYNSKGRKISYGSMIKKLSKTEVLLFGEYHNNSIVHWLELEVSKSIFNKKKIIMGAEMFEQDNQQVVNNYLRHKINQKQLDTLARLWPNYKTDYKPLLDFARANKINFIATNAPRRYASLVYKNGFKSLNKLTKKEKAWIAPLPILYNDSLPSYVKMKSMMGGHGNGVNLPKAQAVKDATMAYFIFSNIEKGKTFIHFNGAYHSNNYEGIFWYLKQKDNNLLIKTLSVVEQENIKKLKQKNKKLADFIIVVPKNMTKTY